MRQSCPRVPCAYIPVGPRRTPRLLSVPKQNTQVFVCVYRWGNRMARRGAQDMWQATLLDDNAIGWGAHGYKDYTPTVTKTKPKNRGSFHGAPFFF